MKRFQTEELGVWVSRDHARVSIESLFVMFSLFVAQIYLGL